MSKQSDHYDHLSGLGSFFWGFHTLMQPVTSAGISLTMSIEAESSSIIYATADQTLEIDIIANDRIRFRQAAQQELDIEFWLWMARDKSELCMTVSRNAREDFWRIQLSNIGHEDMLDPWFAELVHALDLGPHRLTRRLSQDEFPQVIETCVSAYLKSATSA